MDAREQAVERVMAEVTRTFEPVRPRMATGWSVELRAAILDELQAERRRALAEVRGDVYEHYGWENWMVQHLDRLLAELPEAPHADGP
jgi:hypothetical protein